MSNKDGGPAFPREDYQTDNAGGQVGMSLRDYFAIHASDADVVVAMAYGESFDSVEDRSRARYRVADAMLAARESKP